MKCLGPEPTQRLQTAFGRRLKPKLGLTRGFQSMSIWEADPQNHSMLDADCRHPKKSFHNTPLRSPTNPHGPLSEHQRLSVPLAVPPSCFKAVHGVFSLLQKGSWSVFLPRAKISSASSSCLDFTKSSCCLMSFWWYSLASLGENES